MSFEADVSGQIVDDQGRPVPRVEIWSVQPERRDGVFPKALSGPDGRFSLPRPVPGSEGYLVTCPAGFRREQVNVDDLPSGQPLRLPLRRVGRIVGRVVDPDGEPVAGAKVFAQIPGTVFSYVCSNGAPPPLPCSPKTGVSAEAGETGRFAIDSVEPGWYEVSAEGAGLFQQAPRRMLVTSGRTLEPEIVIGQGPVLSGRLFSADGAPLAKASVQLVESREPEWDRVWRTMTDAQGRFHFRGVAAGERRVRAAVEGRGTAQRRVRIGAGETRVDLRLAPDREIRGRVVDAGGAPIERAEIYGEQPFRFSFPTFTDEDGRFSRRLRAEDDEIEVRKSGFVTARSAIHPEIEIVLEPVDETHLR
jgi:protocatechuate 3,4-dioxygenase beta subunit